MIIGIDIDDVIADYMGATLERLKDGYGIAITREQWDEYWLEDHPKLSHLRDAVRQVHDEIFHDGTMKGLDVYPEAKEVILRLAERHEIILVTARGVTRKNVALARGHTLAWLTTHGIPFHGVHFEHEKDLAARHLGIQVFVEDSPENAKAIAASGVRVLLMDQPYNRKLTHTNITRVKGWKDIEKEIERMEQKGD